MQAPMSDNQSDSYGGNRGNSKPLQLIGMAKKAGLLAIGSDDVLKAIRGEKAQLIVFASDTSEGSVRRVLFEAEKLGILSVSTPYTKFEFGRIAGRGSPGTVAIIDLGLAEGFLNRLCNIDKPRYEEIAQLYKQRIENQDLDRSNKANEAGRRYRQGKTAGTSRVDKAAKANNRRTKV